MDVVFAWVCAWIIFIIYIILYYVSLFLIIPIMLGEKVPPLTVEWSSCFFFCENWIMFWIEPKKDICPKHWFLMCSIYIPRCHHLNQTWHKLMKQQRLISYVLIKVARWRGFHLKLCRVSLNHLSKCRITHMCQLQECVETCTAKYRPIK